MLSTVDDITILSLDKYQDNRGILTPVEEFPFPVVRLFYITDIPVGIKRGAHGHKRCQQFLICQAGRLEVAVYDADNERSIEMQAGQAVKIPVGIYVTLMAKHPTTTILVLCDRPYEKDDYLNDRDSIRKFRADRLGDAFTKPKQST